MRNNQHVRTPMKYRTLLYLVSLVLLALSCGGGGGGGGGNDFAGGGISGTGISAGTITGFGSVILNESTYTVTGSTNITVNDTPGQTQGDLKLGMVAVVNFSGTNATSIDADNELNGRIDIVDAPNNALTIMGTQVNTDNDTLFANMTPQNLTGLTAGEFAEVHGLFDFSDNSIRATRIEKISQPGSGEFEVKGTVTNLDTTPGTFQIGSLLVNYIINGLTKPANNDFVEAKGTLSGSTLIASEIEEEDEVPGLDPNDAFEIEGIVTTIDNPANPTLITINNKSVNISSAVFESGDVADLTIGVKTEAEGSLNSSGILIATKIKFRDSVKIEARVDGKGSSTLTMLGSITVKVLSSTDYEGGLSGFGDISVNDYLEIHGYPEGTGTVAALEIKRESDPNRTILQGPAQNISNPNFTILGIPVQTSGSTSFEIDDMSSNAGSFFSTVQAGNIVKAQEDPTDGTVGIIDAAEIDLEGDDD